MRDDPATYRDWLIQKAAARKAQLEKENTEFLKSDKFKEVWLNAVNSDSGRTDSDDAYDEYNSVWCERPHNGWNL